MRATALGLLLGGLLIVGPAAAYDPYDPANCNGVGWDDKRTLVVSAVTAKPRVYFVKSPYDDDFKAETCPSATDACRKKSHLITGDLVLTGDTRGEFTCISYHSPLSAKRIWVHAWLPSAALTPVAPMRAPKTKDWVGTWRQGKHYVGGGHVEIKPEAKGKLHIDAGILMPAGRDFRNGAFQAHVKPRGDTMAFEDDGGGSDYATGCKVRMQRIGPWLLIEDDGSCGGAAVTFTGLYRRESKSAR